MCIIEHKGGGGTFYHIPITSSSFSPPAINLHTFTLNCRCRTQMLSFFFWLSFSHGSLVLLNNIKQYSTVPGTTSTKHQQVYFIICNKYTYIYSNIHFWSGKYLFLYMQPIVTINLLTLIFPILQKYKHEDNTATMCGFFVCFVIFVVVTF